MAIQRQARRGVAAGDADRQVRPGRRGDRAGIAVQEDRREPRVGRRRDPRLQLGPRGGRRVRQVGRQRLGDPLRRVRPGDDQGGDQSHQQPAAQRARIAPRQPGPRQADAQAAQLADGAFHVRPPQRIGGRIRSGRTIPPQAIAWRTIHPRTRLRRAIGQHRQRAMAQAGGDLQPAVRGRIIGRHDIFEAAHQQHQHRHGDGEQQHQVQARRQQLRQTQQRGTQEQPDHPQRRPQRRPDPLEQQRQAGEGPLPGKPAQQTVRVVRRRVHSSDFGRRSAAHKAASAWRGRITVNAPPSTITSAASGRAL